MEKIKVGSLVKVKDNIYYGRERKTRIELGGKVAEVLCDWGDYVKVFFSSKENVFVIEKSGKIKRDFWTLKKDLIPIKGG